MKAALWVVGTLVAVAVAAFLFWTISPFFINTTADEALPVATKEGNTEPHSEVVGTTGHPASGTVRLIKAGGTSYIRYENFKTINGPDIYVYLAKDLNAQEFVDLGRVKATEGNINYEVPAGVNVAEYPYVLVWCKAFGVLFNYAQIN